VKGKVSDERKESRRSIHSAPCVCFGRSSTSAGPGDQFNSNASDLTKIGGVLEEFRQDIIHKDPFLQYGPKLRMTDAVIRWRNLLLPLIERVLLDGWSANRK
jgi:hypothetical protein